MTDFATELERELRWREDELATLKHSLIYSRPKASPRHAALRALWAMLYAHYEGFTKFCWELVLDHVEAQGLSRSDLRECLAILSLEEFFAKTRGDTSAAGLWEAFRTGVPGELGRPARFSARFRLSTESNLWPSVFRAETARLGITCKQLDDNEKRLRTLVSRRNSIAHGEKMVIASFEEYMMYERAVLLLMHELAVEVLEYLGAGMYRAAGAAAPP